MNEILALDNPIMEYTWGSKTHIAKLLGEKTPSKVRQAELWMGAHPKAPSRVGGQTLLEIIEQDPVSMLGAKTAERFRGRLPFLFKLLAADEPLSIQAHPNKERAEAGFSSEDAAGIPLEAPNRNYKDDNHKPELVCALTEFWALNGFREFTAMLELLEETELGTITTELESLRQSPNEEGLRRFFGSIIQIEEQRKSDLLSELLEHARDLQASRPEYRWIIELSQGFPGDVGVLCVLLLNLIRLEPGQAMFLTPGDLHSYLRGFAVELMANSDNVLRGGLTPKHIDIPELLETLTFRSREAEVLVPQAGIYHTPAEEFVLSVLEVEDRDVRRRSPGFEILVSIAGNATVSIPDASCKVPLPQGASVAIPAYVQEYIVSGSAKIYVAGVPEH